MFLDILSDFDVLSTTNKRTDSSTVETIHASGVQDSLKCHRNVTKQTNPLQVDNLIIDKSVATLEASRRILNIVCQNFCSSKCKNFYKHSDARNYHIR
jgi:hypothetical protein